MHPRRGEVWWVAFDPSLGGEMQKTRPAIIVSNNGANMALNRLIVVPLTSQVAKVYAGQAMVTLNAEPRKAMADQLTTVSRQRLRTKLGELTAADITAVERAILAHLAIRR
jgi:mRNA interferase MazF